DDAPDRADRLHELPGPLLHLGASCDLAHDDADDIGLSKPSLEHGCGDTAQLLERRVAGRLDRMEAIEQYRPMLAEDRLEHLVLRREVVVEQTVRDARLLCDVADAR